MFETTRSNFFRKERSKKTDEYLKENMKGNKDKYKSLYVNSVEKEDWTEMSVHLPKVKGNQSLNNTNYDEDK